MIVQKAKHLYLELDKKNPACMGKDYMIFEKYDGWYGYVDINQGLTSQITSRAYRTIPSCIDISEVLSQAVPDSATGRLIFEITIPTIDTFSELNGVLNRSKAPCQASGVVLKCHDFINDPNELFLSRYNALTALIQAIDLPWVQLAPVIKTGSYRDAQELAKALWARGKEGVILKQVDAPYYEGKRNSTLLKIKEDVDADLLVIGMEEGKGKYTGTLGTLVCRDNAGNKHRISGMTDEQRYQWWTNPDSITNRVVEIKAMKKLKDGHYREPRFKAIRHDKTVDDID